MAGNSKWYPAQKQNANQEKIKKAGTSTFQKGVRVRPSGGKKGK